MIDFSNMRSLIFIFALLLSSSGANVVNAQSAAITLDGRFNDWNSNLTTVTDEADTKKDLNLVEMQVTNDQNFLYLRILAKEEFDLTDNLMTQGLYLCIDADNDKGTGQNIRPEVGAEVVIKFRERVVEYYGGTVQNLQFGDIGLRSAPTVTSNEFEIAISRNATPAGADKLFQSKTLRLLMLDTLSGDIIPSDEQGLEYTFDETAVQYPDPISVDKGNTDHIRIIAYNVHRDDIMDGQKQPYFKSLVSTLNPDIIGYSECNQTTAAQIKTLMDSWIPLGTNDGWYVAKKSGSGQITASKWPISIEWTTLSRQYPVLIDLPEKYGKDLLFNNAHLNCCQADAARQAQSDAFASFVLDAKKPGGDIELPEGTPIVMGGDLNLVGFAQQLNTLTKGEIQNTATYGSGGALDWDGTDLTDENYLQTDLNMNYTWRNDNSAFPPGKLDFIIYTDAVLKAEKSFIVQTEVMSDARLKQYGWTKSTTGTASDHFPVVTDFSIKSEASVASQPENEMLIYPNPTTGVVLFAGKDVFPAGELRISNATGELMFKKEYEMFGGFVEMTYPPGQYLFEFRNEHEVYRKKVILIPK